MFYPFPKKLENTASSFTKGKSKGNFSLWYNKLISCEEIAEKPKIDNKFIETYKTCTLDGDISKHLKNKHLDQINLCGYFNSLGYIHKTYLFKAKSRLITGLGQNHPTELGLVLDHIMGIPYIPSSSIKGVVRFVKTLEIYEEIMNDESRNDNLIKSKKKDGEMVYYFDDKYTTDVPSIFGGDIHQEVNGKSENVSHKGKVIFLDCYPWKLPHLTVDIMNPHYGKWYDSGKPPSDDENPVPLHFLAVEHDTEFIMRVLVCKKIEDLAEEVDNCIIKAFTKEGIGAKTAVGYGKFVLKSREEPDQLIKEVEEMKKAAKTEDELLYDSIDQLEQDSDIGTFTNDLEEKTRDKPYRKKAFEKLKQRLEDIEQWKPQGKSKRKQKMEKRKKRIEKIIQDG